MNDDQNNEAGFMARIKPQIDPGPPKAERWHKFPDQFRLCDMPYGFDKFEKENRPRKTKKRTKNK